MASTMATNGSGVHTTNVRHHYLLTFDRSANQLHRSVQIEWTLHPTLTPTEQDRPTRASRLPRSDGQKYGPTQTLAVPSTLILVRRGLLTEVRICYSLDHQKGTQIANMLYRERFPGQNRLRLFACHIRIRWMGRSSQLLLASDQSFNTGQQQHEHLTR